MYTGASNPFNHQLLYGHYCAMKNASLHQGVLRYLWTWTNQGISQDILWQLHKIVAIWTMFQGGGHTLGRIYAIAYGQAHDEYIPTHIVPESS